MQKNKVLLLLHLPPPVHGASVVGKQIQDSKLINSCFDTTFINMSASTNVSEVGNLSIKKCLFLITNWVKSVKTFLQIKPHLVYLTPTSDGWGFYRDFLLVQTLKMLNANIVLHFHNKGSVKWESKFFNKTLLKLFFKGVKIILLGKELIPAKAPFMGKQPVFICPNGMPSVSKPKESNQNFQTIRFLFLSNMMEAKGVLVLLQACSRLKKKGYDFFCDFVGGYKDISEAYFNTEVEKSGLQQHVQAHGPKYGDDKKMFFEKADVFVFPTYYHGECFPLVLIEAMDYSLPSISTDNGAIPSLIENGKTGFCLPQKSVEELVQKMIWFVENPSQQKIMGTASKKRFHEHFTLPKFEQNVVSIFNQCIES